MNCKHNKTKLEFRGYVVICEQRRQTTGIWLGCAVFVSIECLNNILVRDY